MRCDEKAKRVELMSKGAFGDGELRGVCPIKAVYAVDAQNTMLQQRLISMWFTSAIVSSVLIESGS